MLTDHPPHNPARLAAFLASDRRETLEVPPDDRLCPSALAIEAALRHGTSMAVRDACVVFLTVAAAFYRVPRPGVRERGGTLERFGDYRPTTMRIRVWMRTAVHQRVTAFGTFFSTLCHERCHHLDAQRFGWRASPHARGTPLKQLCWIHLPGERWRIDWRRMHRRR